MEWNAIRHPRISEQHEWHHTQKRSWDHEIAMTIWSSYSPHQPDLFELSANLSSWWGPWIERSGWLAIMNPLLMYYHRWLSCGVGRSTCALQNAFPDTDWCGYVPWRKFRSQRELCLPYPADCIQCDWISQPQLSGRQQVARKTRHDDDYRVRSTYIYSLVAEMLGRATTNYLLDFTSSQHGTSDKN